MSITGIVVTLFLASRIIGLARQGDLQISPDQQVFVLGEAEQWSIDVAERGPVFFPDASNRDRDIYVHHIGDDSNEGWLAFAIRPLGSPRECLVRWQAEQSQFVDSCDGNTYPPTGEGLPQYPATVDSEGTLSVDINAAFRDTPQNSED